MGGLSLIEPFPRIQSVKPSQIGVDLNPHTFEDCICVENMYTFHFLRIGRDPKVKKMFDVIPCLTQGRSSQDIAVTMPLSSDPEIEIPFRFPPRSSFSPPLMVLLRIQLKEICCFYCGLGGGSTQVRSFSVDLHLS